MREQIRILITDDHGTTRLGMKQVLKEQFPHARFGEACDDAETLALLRRHPWDLLILDIGLPGRSGVDVLREIKILWPNLPVLVFSLHREEQFARHVLRAQASGYLAKDRAPEELCHAARHILEGGIYLSQKLGQQLASNTEPGGPSASHQELSRREFAVLRMIAAGNSGKMMAAELCLSQKTVSTYRMRILKKLRLRTTSELIQYAIREGLV